MLSPMARILSAFFIVTLMMSAALIAGPRISAASTSTIVQGSVRYPNNSAASGIQVELHTGNASFSQNATTDANGNYTLSVDPSAINGLSLTLELNAPTGYRKPSNSPTNFTYATGDAVRTVDFTFLSASKQIDVTVTDTNGQEVSAQVTAQPINPNGNASQVQQDFQGTGTLDVTGGKWVVKADANLSDTDPSRYPWIAGTAKTVEFVDDDTAETQSVSFTVYPSEELVTVKMVDKDGQILTGNNSTADIAFEGSTALGEFSTTRKISTQDGIARVYLLPGIWHVKAFHPQLTEQSYDPEETTFVVPNEPGTYDWGTLTAITNSGSISGTLTNSSGNELENIRITASNLDTHDQFSDNTNNSGTFTINNASRGSYNITVSDTNYIPTQTGSGKINAEHASIADVALEADVVDLTISGTVEEGSSATSSFPGTLTTQIGDAQYSAPIQSDGTYTLKLSSALIPDSKSSLDLQMITLPGADAYAETQTVSLSKQTGTLNADIPLSTDEAIITGSLVDRDGEEVENEIFGNDAVVKAIDLETGSVETANVAADGSYTLEVGPGDWRVLPQITDPNATGFTSAGAGKMVSVEAGETTSSEDVPVFVPDATLQGTLTDPNGDPIPQAPVIITNLPALQAEAAAEGKDVSPNDIITVATYTDGNGEYAKDLPSGDYTVSFGTTPDQGGSVPAEKNEITIDNKDITVNAEFREASSNINGTVNSGLESATVTLYSENGGTKVIPVDSDGTFSDDMPEGDWKAVVSGVKNGKLWMGESDITVESSENEFNLKAEATDTVFPAVVTTTGDSSEPITISNTDGASVSLPAYSAAFSGDVTLELAPSPQVVFTDNGVQVGLSYDVNVVNSSGIHVTQLNTPATVSLPLTGELAQGFNEKELVAASYSPDTQSFLFDGMVADTDGEKMVIQTNHFSRFSVVTSAAAPNPVKYKTLSAKKITSASATLRWQKPTNSTVTKYAVQLRKKGVKKSSKWTKYNKVKTTQKTVNKLKPNITYQFRIQACNENGCSEFSRWKQFKTKSL